MYTEGIRNMPRDIRIEPPAYSISEFCQAHGIGRSFFYKLLQDGRGPRTMQLGRRRLVSREEAAEWRKRMTDPGPGAA